MWQPKYLMLRPSTQAGFCLMSIRRTTSGLLIVVFMAFLGFILVYVPPQLVRQYQNLRTLGPVWATVYLVVVGTGAVLLLGSSIWICGRLWWRTRAKRTRKRQRARGPNELTRSEKNEEITANLESIDDLRTETEAEPVLRQEMAALVQQLESKRASQTLEIVAFGTVSSGKSSLLNTLAGRAVFATDARGGTTLRRNEVPWAGTDRVVLVDTPGLGEVDGAARGTISAEAAQDADLVLLVVDGPLRDTEYQLVERLVAMQKRVLLCLNKEDWYDPAERQRLLDQLAAQVTDLIDRQDVVAVRARPTDRPRIRVLADGTEVQQRVEQAADIDALARRMLEVIRKDGSDLLLANLLLQSRGLVEQARDHVQAALDKRAWQTVDRYMWGAGGAAALSPLPLLDLAAGGAISVKMVVELARIYRQEVDLNVAVELVGQLGKNLIGILGVTAATPAVTAAIASLLKTVPGAGTLAGGLLQGMVQALITRWIGAVFIEYFRNEMQQPEGGLAGLARRQWQQLTTAAELRKLLQSARRYMATARDDAEPDHPDSPLRRKTDE